ncbi:regulatory protein RecX [Galbibacter sp. EGI 63066]|nr:regulatory protein RecX [Galbibacter sp. EGI 63066]MCX2680508.1 regulatory protein RecX [Galbibacter sp. EGI 63066]
MRHTPSYTVEEAKRKLENYCAYQERCHKDVVKKLKGMNMIPIAIDTIIAHLLEHNFLNEERFAKSYARGKFNIKKWGRRRIVMELKARNISKYNIQSALKEISDSDYYNTLDELAKKRASQITETNIYKKKKKLADYLLYRGWESHLVYEKIKELIG